VDDIATPLISIASPAYNEEENIRDTVLDWRRILREEGIAGEIVITNDGSSDRTGEILRDLQTEMPELGVVTHDTNYGYGKALANAIMATKGEYVLTIDSDGQFDAGEYKCLLEKLQEDDADLVTGFRMGKKDTAFRVLADRVLHMIIRVLFGVSLRDTNCALKLCKGDMLRSLRFEAAGYPTPTEIVLRANARGFKVSEVGITHRERQGGISKLKPFKTGLKMLAFLLHLRIELWLYQLRIIHSL